MKKILTRLILMTALMAMSNAIAPVLLAEEAATTKPAQNDAPPPIAPTPAPEQNQNTNSDPNQGADNKPKSAAERFTELRQKRLDAARAYQQEQEERERALEEQRKLEEEAKLKEQRQQYASEKEAFLAKFKKAATPTPTPTPSVLDQLDELAAPDEAEVVEGTEEVAPTPAAAEEAKPDEVEHAEQLE